MFSYVEFRDLTLSVEGIDRFEADCGEGSLTIIGVEEMDRIEVKVEIYVKSRRDAYAEQFVEDYMLLTLRKKGTKAVLVSHFDNDKFIRLAREKAINLKVKIPANMNIYVDDDSGWVKVMNIDGNLKVDDNSGELTILNIRGDVDIDDDSGRIEVDDITGDVYIDDDSGDIYAENIKGEVEIYDNSGAIVVKNTEGDVIISDDSGDIRVDNIEKNVTIKSDGSGDVHITNVRGKVYDEKDE
jgi:hypothetical protein